MAKFIKGNELNFELEKIFENAETQLFLISPYIKLHERYISSLLSMKDNPYLEIVILFGKNENDLSKSMKKEDFEFFKQFPNLEIRHEKRLHAKYYSNERKAILTSMNLYGFSQNNNIEVGILMESSFKGSFTGENELDNETWKYFSTVLRQSELLFDKKPTFEKRGLLRSEEYVDSEILVDKLSDFFGKKQYKKIYKKTTTKTSRPEKHKKFTKSNNAFCIRTGTAIPFNIEKPLNYEAFKMWNKYKDSDFPEKFCHFSGEKSNGETSVNSPILKKYWNKAKSIHNF